MINLNTYKKVYTHSSQALKTLHTIGFTFARAENLASLGQTIVEQLVQDLDYEFAILYVSEKAETHFYPIALTWQEISDADETLFLTIKNQVFTLDQIPQDIINQTDSLDIKFKPFINKYPQIKSMLFAPVKVEGETTGLIGIESTKPNAFTVEDQQTITIIAYMLANFVRNARLLKQLHQEHKTFDALQEISAVLVSSQELDQTLKTILDSLTHLLEFDSAAIYLLTPDNHLKMVASKGIPNEQVTMASARTVRRFPLDETVISGKKPVAITDVRQDIRWTPLKGTEYIRSWVGVPLLIRDKPIGLFTIDHSTVEPFTPNQVALAEAFASYAAVVIENARLFSEVKSQQQRMRKLSNKVVEAQEEERRRISRELHDEMGQALTAIKLNLQMLLNNFFSDETEVITHINEIINLTNDSLQEVRRLAMDLRPSILDDLGLVPTLHWYQNQFQKRSGIKMVLSIDKNLPRLSTDTETALYRVIQEALTNVTRHANASQVEISFSQNEEAVYCSVIDNGKGFTESGDQSLYTKGVGLTSMTERIEGLNGQINIDSKVGGGTSIFISIPKDVALNPKTKALSQEKGKEG
jgi:signal transduction histidine kinase